VYSPAVRRALSTLPVLLLLLSACGGEAYTGGALTINPHASTELEVFGDGKVILKLEVRGGPAVELVMLDPDDPTTEVARTTIPGDASFRTIGPRLQRYRLVNSTDEPVHVAYGVTAKGGVGLNATMK
jgi:hypothetical protein